MFSKLFRNVRMVILATLVAVSVGACQKPGSDRPPPAAEERPAQPPGSAMPSVAAQSVSAEEWRAAFASSFTASKKKGGSDGTSEFMACFEAGEPKCKLLLFGDSDAFRKLTFFTPLGVKLQAFVRGNYLRTYLSVKECGRPVVILEPFYFSKSGWLFMHSVAVMADGEVVLEKNFREQTVDRSTDSPGVEESIHLPASAADVEGVRRAAAAKQIVVRITGDKGYVTARPDDAAKMKEDFAQVLGVAERINAAVDAKVDPACTQ